MRPFFLRFVARNPETGTIALVAIVFVSFALITQGLWLSPGNVQSVVRLAAVLGIMSFGEAIVLATGEIDISVGSTFGIGALTFLGVGPITGSGIALIAALLAGIIIGALNGFFAAVLEISSLIVTLATLFLFQGIAYAFTFGFSFVATNEMRKEFIYNAVGGGLVGDLNVAILWAIGILAGLHFLVFDTPLGNRVLAVGGDAASTYSRGVSVTRIKFGAFLVSGLLATFAGVLEAAFIGYADGSFGASMELSAIAAAVLGGCHLRGGQISLVGTIFGAFLLCGIQSFLIILGVQPQWYILMLGVIVVFVSLLDRTFARLVARK